MKKRLLIACAASLVFTGSFAQSAWKFRSSDYLGLAVGQTGSYFQMQTINGLYKRSWFLGIGAGLDYYRSKSIPLFVSVTKDLMPGKNGLFVSLDGGINFPWHELNNSYYFTSRKFHSGPYWSAGLGYKIKLSGHSNQALLLSAGYSFKELKEDRSIDIAPYLGSLPHPTQINRYDYRYRRLSVKIGWQF